MLLDVDLLNPDPKVVSEASRVLRRGGIVVYPTDTIYGIGCDALNERSVRRILKLKGRPREKGFLVLVAAKDWLHRLALSVPSEAEELLETFWPGPLTVLVEAADQVPEPLLDPERRLGVRLPAPPFLQQWIQHAGVPIVSTSANLSGEPYRGDLNYLRTTFLPRVDLFLECSDPRTMHSAPSTVVDLTRRPFRIVRRGAASEALEAFLAEINRTD